MNSLSLKPKGQVNPEGGDEEDGSVDLSHLPRSILNRLIALKELQV